jgi:hypothetical protein
MLSLFLNYFFQSIQYAVIYTKQAFKKEFAAELMIFDLKAIQAIWPMRGKFVERENL